MNGYQSPEVHSLRIIVARTRMLYVAALWTAVISGQSLAEEATIRFAGPFGQKQTFNFVEIEPYHE